MVLCEIGRRKRRRVTYKESKNFFELVCAMGMIHDMKKKLKKIKNEIILIVAQYGPNSLQSPFDGLREFQEKLIVS